MTGNHIVQDQSAVAACLADPASHGGEPVTRIDTHGAMVFLAGARAYKVKRAVAYPYMDFSTLKRRAAACRAEVRLNRRTAPEIYLGVAPILRGDDGRLKLGEVDASAGAAIEWAVVMRRFDPAATFDLLAAAGEVTGATMRRIAEAVAALHEGAEVVADANGADPIAAVAAENIEEFGESPDLFPAAEVDRLHTLTQATVQAHASLLDNRAETGRVRHCHGDLHLRNICLFQGRPTLFDAIEFNDGLARIDVFYDLAFLLMDLDRGGMGGFANQVANRYLERTGDYGGLALVPLFLSLRAAVRAKVGASMAAVQSDPIARADLRAAAVGNFRRAAAYLEPASPVLVAVGGLSGTGKTTLARGLAPALGAPPGAVVLRSDVIRKQLAGVDESVTLADAAYGPESSARVYAELYRRAAEVIGAGHGAVADGVFAEPAERARIERVAHDAGVGFVGLWLETDPAILKRRVADRHGDASDAGVAVVDRQLAYRLGPIGWHRIDAADDKHRILAAARETVRAAAVNPRARAGAAP